LANDNEITQLEQVKARLAEINRMKADGRRLTREELEEFQRLTVEMDDLLSSSTARVESLQKEVAILDQYLAKVQGLNKSADGLLLNREVQTEQLRNQYELEQQLVKLQDEITQADLDRLKNMDTELRAQEELLEVQREMVDNAEQTTALVQAAESAAIKLGIAFQGAMAGDFTAIMGQMNVGMQKLGGYLTGNFIGGLKDMVIQFDKTSKAFETQFAMGQQYEQQLGSIYGEQAQLGVSMEELTKGMGDLITNFTDFTGLAPAQRRELAKTATVMQEAYGVATQDFSRGLQTSTKALGMNVSAAKNYQGELVETAKAIGVAPAQLSAQFAEMGPQLAKFGRQGGKAFKELARISKLTGMEMGKVLAITNKFDTFEGAAEQAGQLNAALGGNFVNAMDMMMATDPAERFGMIRDAILDTGLTFDDMSYYQKQFYTNSLGLSDVGDLALMLSGDMSAMGDATNKTSKDYEEQAKRAAALMDIQEKLKAIFLESAPAVEKLANMLATAANFVAKFSTEILYLSGLYVAYQGLQAAIAIKRKLTSVFRKADAVSEVAEINSVTVALKAQEKAQKKLNKAKKGATGSPIAGMSAPAIAAVGLALIGLGLGFMAAGKGIAFMAEAMQDMSIGQIVAMAVPIGALAVAFYALAPAIISAGAASAGAALPMMAFGAAIALVGGGIGAAAAGVGLMATGMSNMFESITVEKLKALGAFLAAAALGSAGLIAAGIGLGAFALGFGVFNLSLSRLSTEKMGHVAKFTESLSNIEFENLHTLSKTIRAVAKAMNDLPTEKTILFQATMRRTEQAAAVIKAMQKEAPSAVASKTTTTTAGSKMSKGGTKAQLTINMNIDGEKFESKVVNIVEDHEGRLAIDGLSNRA
jgi:hypothetical protein